MVARVGDPTQGRSVTVRVDTFGVGPAAYVFAVTLAVQSFHMLEHVVQVLQAFVFHILPAHGILGSIFDLEWVHFFYNTDLYLFLILGAVVLVLERRPRPRAGWRWLGASLAFQTYHEIEHIVKIAQHISTGIDPAPGILGHFINLIWLHFTFNLIITSLVAIAFVKLGLHHEIAPVARLAARRVLRPRVLLPTSAVLAAGLVAAVAVTAKPPPTRGPNLGCADVAATSGLNFSGEYGPVFPALDAMGAMMQRDMGNGAAVGDYNGDGYLDVVLLGQAGRHTKLYRNDPGVGNGRHFSDVTNAAGLGAVTSNARVAQFLDLTGSGRPDLVIAADYMPGGPAGPSQIFRNNGDGTFTDVTAGSGFDPTGYIVGGMTFADYDGSGRASIWLSYWTQELAGDPGLMRIQGAFPGHNRLYENLGDYHFKDVTESLGISEYHADSFTAVFADFTGDGLPDIYQANDHRTDRFYRNMGGGQFRDDTTAVGLTRAGNSMGVATTVGSGGRLDLYVTNITDPGGTFGTNQGNTFMMSSQDAGGTLHFTDEAASHGIVDTAWGWGTQFVDMHGDGAPDIYAVQGMREFVGNGSVHLENATSSLFLNDGSGLTFKRSDAPGCQVPGDQRALVVFDFNRDGSPDLLISQVAGPPILLENLISGRNWLTVAATGPADAGINARITVTAGGRSQTQIILAGGSYLAGPPREAYFGLGGASAATVKVAWANGETSEYVNVPAGQVLQAKRP